MSPPNLSRRHVVSLIGAAVALPAIARATPAGAIAKLRVLATTDLHSYLFSWDYARDAEDLTVGYARTVALLRQARAEAANSITVDNGDLIQGSPLGDWAANEEGGLSAARKQPMIAAMNAVGYDAATVGNHDFNFGLDVLDKAVAGAAFPYVCTNVLRAGDRTPYFPPYTILTRALKGEDGREHPIKIGVIGFVTPQITMWDRDKLAGKVETIDIVDAARLHVPKLKAEGADIVVALSHSGLGGAPRQGGEENASVYLADVPGIDVIVTGHSHRVFPGPDYAHLRGADLDRGEIAGHPASMAGFYGSHLGVLDLTLVREEKGWTLVDAHTEARPIYTRKGTELVATVAPDAATEAIGKPGHEATLAFVRKPLGTASGAITSWFALLGDNIAAQVIAAAETDAIVRAVAGTDLAKLPLIAMASPFKAGGNPGPGFYTEITPGPIALRSIADLYPYPNTLQAVRVTGAELAEWLEMSARVFAEIVPKSDTPQLLIDPGVPSYSFDVAPDLTYTIDVTQKRRYDSKGRLANGESRRVRDIAYRGKPLDPAQPFLVATNSYRAGGGGFFPGLGADKIVYASPDPVQQVIARYVQQLGSLGAMADMGGWRFAPVPRTAKLIFDTSPHARDAAKAIPALAFQETTAAGFDRYTLDLGGA